jgi:dGTPase
MKHLGVRERLEELEIQLLSPFAAKSRFSKGRLRPEEPSPVRTEFQRDRDRVIHCKAFRRLKHKTQVFLAPLGDHYMTRLTHVLQVTQVARTIARALRLNEDLTEAIGLAHDLGHPPFGHAGEEALAELYPEGFRHNLQSLRVVDKLENDGRGLNLTMEVREAIPKHSKERGNVMAEAWGTAETLEGQVVKLADSIAYISHDIEDAIRAGIITPQDLPGDAVRVLGRTHGERINTMVCAVIEYSWAATGEGLTPEEAARTPPPPIGMDPTVLGALNTMREFMFERVYTNPVAKAEFIKAKDVIRRLYEHFCKHPELIPEKFFVHEDPIERVVVDYIAGMTDRYALHLYEELFIPKLWAVMSVPVEHH